MQGDLVRDCARAMSRKLCPQMCWELCVQTRIEALVRDILAERPWVERHVGIPARWVVLGASDVQAVEQPLLQQLLALHVAEPLYANTAVWKLLFAYRLGMVI